MTRSRRRGVAAAACALVLAALAGAPVRALGGHGFGIDVPWVSPFLLMRLLDGRAVAALIDLRPAAAYQQGHLPGARSMPILDFPRRAGEVPRAGRVVLYADVLVDMVEAHRALEKLGYDNVEILEGGFAAWVRRGLPVEAGR